MRESPCVNPNSPYNWLGSRLRRFPLEIGTINGVSGDKKYNDLFYSFVSFLTPGTIYRIDVTKVSAFRVSTFPVGKKD